MPCLHYTTCCCTRTVQRWLSTSLADYRRWWLCYLTIMSSFLLLPPTAFRYSLMAIRRARLAVLTIALVFWHCWEEHLASMLFWQHPRVHLWQTFCRSWLYLEVWSGGVTVEALGLQFSRLRVWLPAILLFSNYLGQVVHTRAYVTSSIIWYQSQGSNVLWLRRWT